MRRHSPRRHMPWYRPGSAAPAADWWLAGEIDPANCVAAYQAIGAASLTDSYINLANPGTYNAALGVAPTWSAAAGWTFDGSTQWLSTGWVPADTQNQSVVIRFSNGAPSATRVIFGCQSSGARFEIFTYLASTTVSYANGASGVGVAPTMTAGNIAIAGAQGYRNGTAEGTALPAYTATPTLPCYIAATRTSSAALLWPGTIQALAIYNTAISPTQVAALVAAMGDLA